MNVFYLPSAHKTQVEFRSHFSGKKIASYGPGNMVIKKNWKISRPYI